MFGFIWKSKQPEVSKYKLTVLFDLDQTLFHVVENVQHSSAYQELAHLTKARSLLHDFECFMIYLPLYEIVFKLLLQIEGVRIGFITMADYDRRDVLELLVREYGLPDGALNKSIYINRNKYGNGNTLKGVKIDAMRKRKIFSPEEEILLIDDNLTHLQNAAENGCSVIHATGLLHYTRTDESGTDVYVYSNDTYFDNINDAVCALINKDPSVPVSPKLRYGI